MFKNQLRRQCQRGMKELDILLLGYLDHAYTQATNTEQATFVFLLNQSDMDLFDWLIKHKPAQGIVQNLIDKILKVKLQIA